jgi:hypothetical protein
MELINGEPGMRHQQPGWVAVVSDEPIQATVLSNLLRKGGFEARALERAIDNGNVERFN